MFLVKYGRLISMLLLACTAGCHRPLTVSKNDYIQYSIDQQLPQDSAIVRYYLPYKEKLQQEMNRVIGQTEQELTKPADPETLMGNFFADALLTEGLKRDTSIQFAFANRGGLRITFPKGDITVSHVFGLMPFENQMVVLKLRGSDVWKLASFIAAHDGEPVSGLRMKIRNKLPDEVTIAGMPLDTARTYQMLTYDYLADGGGDLDFLRFALERRDLNQKVREALLENISDMTRSGQKINVKLDGRIVVEN
ncbi:5'-nucleotidase C-terminal domain-containing protein [Dyadobacter sandarakinus]|uniref:5'-nucleotidase C-terminal domain-containing protein n=1 Tax=Dyadobacter sandarakinus TaxID=2747268 RepID=A0ABX7I431_9BACT|nr:5'-nucleotidase [Dyadobacter sandarakinus]QRR00493.1 5'-nucleotidase C-terminal domain-containing protein [Dyadobacter sandarakinus]